MHFCRCGHETWQNVLDVLWYWRWAEGLSVDVSEGVAGVIWYGCYCACNLFVFICMRCGRQSWLPSSRMYEFIVKYGMRCLIWYL